VASRTLKKPTQAPVLWAIAALSFIAIAGFQLPFPWVVLAAALTGWLGQRLLPAQFAAGGGHGAAQLAAPRPAAWLDDDTPTPPHARYRPRRLAAVLLVAAALWLLPMGLLTALWGWDHTLTQMGWFFTKAALLTFGGAYAVLPYVYQGAVEHYGWLTPVQMIDGLALGETTPGPLIMVVAFVAFVGGWTHPMFGTDAIVLAAVVSACVATFFTFLPSFVFILAGGPLVEATHGQLGFTAPLVAVTAAVVGVIVNLSVFFAQHVLWPDGFGGAFAWASALIGLASAVALMRFGVSVTQVLGACALIGLAQALMG
jgi:chromate transporter